MLTEAGKGERRDGPATPVVNGFFFLGDASSLLRVRQCALRTVVAALFGGVIILGRRAVIAAPTTRVLHLQHIAILTVCYLCNIRK